MNPSGVEDHAELRKVPSDVLEKYVRSRLLAVAGNATVSQRLGVPAESIRQAFAYVLSDNASWSRLNSDPNAAGQSLQLSFGHKCQNLGCNEPGCLLCAQNPNRRCSSDFSAKYLAGDVLKANCGASIRVQVIDRATLEAAQSDLLADVQLEICIIDGKAYAALQSANREHEESEVEACILATNNQGKELLVPHRGVQHNAEKWVVVPLVNGDAYLPDLTITGSSEALLSGQKPPFRLLVRAMNAKDGTRASNIRFVVSDAFVVATPRVRTAAKAEIPHLDDHVSKLHSVGNMTQTKLQDIRAAAEVVGIHNLIVPFNTVTKVGQFKELVEVAEQDPRLCETLKKVLKLTRGWEIARDHARTAVVTDNKMRVWCPKTSDGKQASAGMLFRGHLGSADLENPVGLLTLKEGGEGQQAVMEPVLAQKMTPEQRETFKKLQKEAIKCWWEDNHPGWAIWPIDSNQFLQEMSSVNTEMLHSDALIGHMQGPPATAETRPMTRASTLAQKIVEQTTSQSSSDRNSQEAAGICQEGGQPPVWATGNFSEASHATRMQSNHFPSFPPQPPHLRNVFDPDPLGLPAPGDSLFPPTSQGALNPMGQPNPMDQPSTMSQPNLLSQRPQNPGQHAQNPHQRSEIHGGMFSENDQWYPPSMTQPQCMPLGSANAGGANLAWGDDFRTRGQGNATDFSVSPQPGNTFPQQPQRQTFGGNLREGMGGGQVPPHRSFTPQPNQFAENPFPLNMSHQPSLKPWPASEGMTEGGRAGPQSWPQSGGQSDMASLTPTQGQHFPQLSGVARKRDSHTPLDAGFADVQKSNPLPSPFGMALMQDMDIPSHTHMNTANQQQLMNARLSSGMQPSSAKRQHLTPSELQERWSHMFGKPLRTQEISKLFPDFSGVYDHEFADKDLVSMPLAMCNFSSVMESFLDHDDHSAKLNAVTNADLASAPGQQPASSRGDGGPALPSLFQGMDFTYGDFSDAVDLASKPQQERNATLNEPKNSQVLVDFLTSWIHPTNEDQPQTEGAGELGALGLKEEQKSGLDTMNDIQQALPSQPISYQS